MHNVYKKKMPRCQVTKSCQTRFLSSIFKSCQNWRFGNKVAKLATLITNVKKRKCKAKGRHLLLSLLPVYIYISFFFLNTPILQTFPFYPEIRGNSRKSQKLRQKSRPRIPRVTAPHLVINFIIIIFFFLLYNWTQQSNIKDVQNIA